MTQPPRPLYGIDSGGSTTSIAVSTGERWTAPSVNPSSVPSSASARSAQAIFDRIRWHAAGHGGRPAVWLAAAALDPAAPGRAASWLAAAARAAGLAGDLVISNDLSPLLLAGPAGVGHVVAVCGTGSGFTATDGRSPPRRIGGCEYLASDEGSAFDLGLRGLRAAVRGLDGRAARTTLTSRLARGGRAGLPGLARTLAQTPFPKAAVAALAPVVVRAWQDGDQVAGQLVADAIGELLLGVRAARDAAGLTAGWRLTSTGGVLAGSPPFFAEFAAAAGALGADPVSLVTDPVVPVLAALAQAAAHGPVRLADRRLGGDVRHLDLTASLEETGAHHRMPR